MDAGTFSNADSTSVELSSRRTGMSFQRTRMSADRTLMSVIRTSLSLISFGFTIYQFFEKLREAKYIPAGTGGGVGRFGTALVAIGIGMLIFGIIYHIQFMVELRRLRQNMTDEGLIHGKSHFPTSLTLIVALILLVIGFGAIVSMIFNVSFF
ncbi:MAG TPA: DUF202 domain-containing protein [Candidatus Tumulicola sp.]|jgi:putative membrane protein